MARVMNKRMPFIMHARKVCIICEGDEEHEYLYRLKNCKCGVKNMKLFYVMLKATVI